MLWCHVLQTISEISLAQVRWSVLPQGYEWAAWRLSLLERHALAKFESFRDEIDSRFFPPGRSTFLPLSDERKIVQPRRLYPRRPGSSVAGLLQTGKVRHNSGTDPVGQWGQCKTWDRPEHAAGWEALVINRWRVSGSRRSRVYLTSGPQHGRSRVIVRSDFAWHDDIQGRRSPNCYVRCPLSIADPLLRRKVRARASLWFRRVRLSSIIIDCACRMGIERRQWVSPTTARNPSGQSTSGWSITDSDAFDLTD